MNDRTARTPATTKGAPRHGEVKLNEDQDTADRVAAERHAAQGAERVFHGLGVSPGVSIGPAHLRESRDLQVLEYQIPARAVGEERERFDRAVKKARRQLGKIRSKAGNLHGTAAEELGYLLDAHLQMLHSRSLLDGVVKRLDEQHINAEAAVMAEIDRIAEGFAEMDDSYLKARAQEIREVGLRIVRNLMDAPYRGFDRLEEGSIIIAEEISPADTALMDPRRIGGFATVLGGAEGHTAIMARSLGLPAVLGVADLMGQVKTGETVIVDGSNGVVVVNPSDERLASYRRRMREIEREARALKRLRDLPADTRDGVRVTLQANLELPPEVGQAVAAGASGIGLLRTEFLYMNREDLPGEDEQYEALRSIVEGMGGRPVTIRTLDIGGEKLAWSLGAHMGESANPALGLRAIRLSLKERKLLDTQLAAILRAAAHGPVRVLLPLVTSTGELQETRRALAEVYGELQRRRVPLPEELPPVGAMIEVPGAALSADALAGTSDFFAIGTNDLTMYTLAIDRAEERVAHLYNPLHPAVLRLIQFAVEAALRARIPVSVCGEMAGDPRYTPLFLGLGIKELSMAPNSLPRVKQRIRQIDMTAATHRAQAIMDQRDSGRIAALLDDFNG
ncbi:phosphoenolpyruvate--protein phosphotransferase [Ferruginivarius sediminum]|uniref:Phosphoenolpyruvate-protein phosphotransferase n=1 Tax=Ferruginivarius sediminum TaxID=2661937 RepID=A0A369T7K4_9PROT|nr:phosphoenolpyruvate--protein phosphotransferase [Ferruginivarius sediminum]RDD60335.1 phosphoenolpyruvate--protein phosphotransferase [Ferruginivarius sediminum]